MTRDGARCNGYGWRQERRQVKTRATERLNFFTAINQQLRKLLVINTRYDFCASYRTTICYGDT